MKAFHFRIEALLVLRKSETSQALEAFGQAVQRVREVEKVYKKLATQISHLGERIKSARGTLLSAGEQSHLVSLMSAHKQRIVQIIYELKIAKEAEKSALTLLHQAKKNENILLRLKEKKHALYLQEFLKEEEKIFEDIVNARRLQLSRLT